MQPIPTKPYADVWIMVKLEATGLVIYTDVLRHSNVYLSEEDAKNSQLMEALRGNVYHIFHLEIPIQK